MVKCFLNFTFFCFKPFFIYFLLNFLRLFVMYNSIPKGHPATYLLNSKLPFFKLTPFLTSHFNLLPLDPQHHRPITAGPLQLDHPRPPLLPTSSPDRSSHHPIATSGHRPFHLLPLGPRLFDAVLQQQSSTAKPKLQLAGSPPRRRL